MKRRDTRMIKCADPDCGCYHSMDKRILDKSIRATTCPNCACAAFLPTYPYTVICSWCKTKMGVKYSEDEKMNGTVSHSICLNCAAKLKDREEE